MTTRVSAWRRAITAPPASEANPWLSVIVLGGSLALMALAALMLLWPMLGKPLVYDEVSFMQMGEAIAQTGVPYTNVGFMIERGYLDRQFQFGLWHPPLYLYALGLAIKLFGASEQTARLLGVATMMLTALFIVLTVRTALRDHPSRDGLALFGAVLYIFNPLTLQSALVLDIDGTVLTVVVMALVWLYLVASDWGFAGRLLIGVLFAVALSAKMTTPCFLLPAIVVYRTLQGRPDRGISEAATIGITGGVLFLTGWRLATWLFRMPFEMPFEVLYLEFQDATSHGIRSLRTFDAFAGAAQPAIRWFGPYLPLILLGATAVRAVDHIRFGLSAAAGWLGSVAARIAPDRKSEERRVKSEIGTPTGVPTGRLSPAGEGEQQAATQHSSIPALQHSASKRRSTFRLPPTALTRDGLVKGQPIDLLIVLTWTILVVYLIKTAAEFPKYHIAAVPPLATTAALFAGRMFQRLGFLEVVLHPFTLAALVAYFFFEVGERYFNTWNYDLLGPMLRAPILIAIPALVVGVIVARRIAPQLILLPALVSVAWTFPAVHDQSLSPYSTNYFYGSGGAFEIAQVAERVLRPDEFYLSSKDVAYYLSNKNYVDQDSFWWLLNVDKQKFTGDWFGRPIRVIVIFGRDPFLRQQFYSEFEGRYEVREVIGDFALLTRLPGR